MQLIINEIDSQLHLSQAFLKVQKKELEIEVSNIFSVLFDHNQLEIIDVLEDDEDEHQEDDEEISWG